MNAKADRVVIKGIGMVIRRCEIDGGKTEERAYQLMSVKTLGEIAKGIKEHRGLKVCIGALINLPMLHKCFK